MTKLFSKKPVEVLLAQANEEGEHTLKRGLGPFALTMIGIGSIIGAGIFVLTGQQAAVNAGPGILYSFILAGITCALAALCYAELASTIPVSGSAYTYAYATMGEFVAWLIAWDLIIEYLFAASTVAAGWSGTLNNMLEGFGLTLPQQWAQAPYAFTGHHLEATGAILNLPAMFIVGLMAVVLISGITQSSLVNSLIVSLKVLVVLVVIGFGVAYINPEFWDAGGAVPLIPDRTVDVNGVERFGIPGVITAAGVIFFAYIGFETVSTAAQEAKDPQRTMPIGILAALAICTILYIAMALVITGLAPYQSLDTPAPVSVALQNVPELGWLRQVVNIGICIGLASTILALLYGQSRIFYSMARDGLLPPLFAKVNPKTRTPAAGTIITATAAALIGGLFPIGVLGELVSMGTLLAFSVICIGVIWLRFSHPNLPRAFKTPLWFITAPLGAIACLYLAFSLPQATWWRLGIWMAIGLVVYFGYAYKHSRYHEQRAATLAE